MKTNQTAIGMLRQWLNEDRIDDPKKMVTNEQIEKWLLCQPLKEEEGECCSDCEGHDTGCGSNAAVEDGFGYCTCKKWCVDPDCLCHQEKETEKECFGCSSMNYGYQCSEKECVHSCNHKCDFKETPKKLPSERIEEIFESKKPEQYHENMQEVLRIESIKDYLDEEAKL